MPLEMLQQLKKVQLKEDFPKFILYDPAEQESFVSKKYFQLVISG